MSAHQASSRGYQRSFHVRSVLLIASVRAGLFRMRALFVFLLMIVMLHALVPGDGLAQEHPFDPGLKVCIQDTVCFLRLNACIVGGDTLHPHVDTIPERCYAPSHEFTMNYDSTCEITYMFTECRLEGGLWKLARWRMNHHADVDSDVSIRGGCTVPAILHEGESISFFRYLRWRNPMTQLQDTGNYYATDALDFSVELVRTSDSTRLVLLDSIGIEADTTPGRPLLHGRCGLLALAGYRVPAAYDGVEAFLRVRPWCGSGRSCRYSRSDGVTICASGWLHDTSFTWIDAMFGVPEAAFAPGELNAAASDGHALMVLHDMADPASATIAFECSPEDRATTVAVYDAQGNFLFAPYRSVASHGAAIARYRFPHGGMYFVALLYEGRLVATRGVTITR